METRANKSTPFRTLFSLILLSPPPRFLHSKRLTSHEWNFYQHDDKRTSDIAPTSIPAVATYQFRREIKSTTLCFSHRKASQNLDVKHLANIIYEIINKCIYINNRASLMCTIHVLQLILSLDLSIKYMLTNCDMYLDGRYLIDF